MGHIIELYKNKIAPRLSLPGDCLLEGESHWEREGPKFRPQKSKMKSPRLPPQGAQASGFRGFGFQRGQEEVWEAGLGGGAGRVESSHFLCTPAPLCSGSPQEGVSKHYSVF